MKAPGQLHHVELYVRDLSQSLEFWAWLLNRLGYHKYQDWQGGQSWRLGNGTYIVFVQVNAEYKTLPGNRQTVGLNHLAFEGESPSQLSEIAEELRRRSIPILARDADHLCFEDLNGIAVEIFAPSAPEREPALLRIHHSQISIPKGVPPIFCCPMKII